jgi:hypothetical protein
MNLQERVDELEAQQGSRDEDHLIWAPIVEYEPHGTMTPGVNATYYVAFDDRREAFHKPFSGVNVPSAEFYGHHPDEPPIHECAAWRLARALGSPYARLVAPCILREIEGEVGSLSAAQRGLSREVEIFERVPDDCLAAAFFDSLIGQQDRHRGNYRWDCGNEKLGLIDHGYAFAHRPDQYFNRSVFIEWRWDAARGDLTEAEREALEGLLASGDLHGLERFLLPEEAEALASRAERMLERGTILDLGEF